MIDFLIATSTVDEAACMGDQALLQHAQLTASQAAKMREDLNRLPAMAKMSDKIDVCARLTYLNNVMDCAAAFSQRGPASLVASDEAAKLASEARSDRADHGTYPAELADLAPDYVVKVPKDIFDDSDLHYRLEGEGYLLYSVRVNVKDDGAKSYEDSKQHEGWDDLCVRVPAPGQE